MKTVKKLLQLVAWSALLLALLLTLGNIIYAAIISTSPFIIERVIRDKHVKNTKGSSLVSNNNITTNNTRVENRNSLSLSSKKSKLKNFKVLKIKRIKELLEIDGGRRYYLPFKDSPCLFCVDGLSVTCLGAITVSEISSFSGDLDALLSTALRLKVDFTCSLICSSTDFDAEPLWKIGVLILLRNKLLRG